MTGFRRQLTARRGELAAQEPAYLHARPFGTIEFARHGEGTPSLVSHPLFGGFDAALGLARTYADEGFAVVAPSRFGYLGSMSAYANAAAAAREVPGAKLVSIPTGGHLLLGSEHRVRDEIAMLTSSPGGIPGTGGGRR